LRQTILRAGRMVVAALNPRVVRVLWECGFRREFCRRQCTGAGWRRESISGESRARKFGMMLRGGVQSPGTRWAVCWWWPTLYRLGGGGLRGWGPSGFCSGRR